MNLILSPLDHKIFWRMKPVYHFQLHPKGQDGHTFGME